MDDRQQIRRLLVEIYGESAGNDAAERILRLVDRFPVRSPARETRFTEKDVVLITYADTLLEAGVPPLATLESFASRYLADTFSAVHLLPFFPWSSDDGFSVVDFYEVDPELGRWEDVHRIKSHFNLMFDFVLNHVSAKSRWFERYLAGEPGFSDLAIEVDPHTDLSGVVRPRALPLLTPFTKKSGRRVSVWTTFSADQIDLNYQNPEVLEKMVRVFLFYIEQGADMIRMDAVAYLWKEIGTSCIHLPQTHAVVKLFRKILDIIAPAAIIITETNVPHEENVGYFGSGGDEAQMVYNFSLPPLLLHAFAKGNASVLSGWARGLNLDSPENTFFNFTASHDGIGVRPLEGILPPSEIELLIQRVKLQGGNVSYKTNPGGDQSPYEMNITLVDAMREPGEDDPLHAPRFLASQAVALVLPGVPGVYIHSILGSNNWADGVAQTGRARTINRERLPVERVRQQLGDKKTLRAKIFFPYRELIRLRCRQPALHPNAGLAILDLDPRLFAVLRFTANQKLLAVINVSDRPAVFSPAAGGMTGAVRELNSGAMYSADQAMTLGPYRFAWLV